MHNNHRDNHIGNCVDSFDQDGECINPMLPWCDVSAFACTIEELGDNCSFCGIVIEYDEIVDIHNFYQA